MIKTLKIFQYAYIIIAIVFIWEAIGGWSEDRGRSYMLLVFSALAIFMFFFRRHFRQKFEDRNKQS